MKTNIDKYRVLYCNKKKLIYIMLLSTLLYLFIFSLFYDVPNLFISILSVFYLIGACIVVMLCKSIMDIHKKIYYKFISCIYLCMSMISMFTIIPMDLINNVFLLALRNEMFLDTIYIQNLVIGFYKIIRYINKKQELAEKLVVLAIILTVGFFVNYISVLLNIKWVLQLTNLSIILILFLMEKNLKDIKLVIGNKINAVILLTYIITIIAIINIVILTCPFKYSHIILVNRIIIFNTYILLLVFIIDKLINRPYKILFADLCRENLELDILNGKVCKKNRDLELSQAIIRKKEKMFKNFFINVPVPLVIISMKGRILFANLSFQKLLDKDNIKNIINKKIIKVIEINNFKSIEQLIEDKDKTQITGVVRNKENTKYLDIDIVEISGNDNQVLFILNDITTRVNIGKLKTDMENTKAQERIKRDFLSNISHDLKTPINVIYSASQLVTKFIEKADKQSLMRYNMICKLNCFSLIRLTNNLIDSSRIYSDFLSPNITIRNIVEIVEEVVMSLIDYAKSKNISLVFDTDKEEIYASIDEEFMQRIVINLISNAIKFTNQNGKIEVVITNENKEVVINVRDNGVGMDDEFIKNAFKRYSMDKNNAKSKEKGTGIGLFVVKKLIEKQGGKINIKSKKNKGTDVEMRFNKEM